MKLNGIKAVLSENMVDKELSIRVSVWTTPMMLVIESILNLR